MAYEFLRDEFGEGHQTARCFLVARFPEGALAPESRSRPARTSRVHWKQIRASPGSAASPPSIRESRWSNTKLLYRYAPGIGDPWARALAETFTRENAAFMLVEPSVPSTSPEAEGLVEAIRAYRDANGLDLLVGGGAAGLKDFVDRLYTDFPKAVLLILVITYVVLAVLFRSVVLPLKAVLLNVLSLLASFGALVLVFQDGWLSNVLRFEPLGYIDSLLPVVLFAMLFGLSMDYEVFPTLPASRKRTTKAAPTPRAWPSAWNAAAASSPARPWWSLPCAWRSSRPTSSSSRPWDSVPPLPYSWTLPSCARCWCPPRCTCWAAGTGGRRHCAGRDFGHRHDSTRHVPGSGGGLAGGLRRSPRLRSPSRRRTHSMPPRCPPSICRAMTPRTPT